MQMKREGKYYNDYYRRNRVEQAAQQAWDAWL